MEKSSSVHLFLPVQEIADKQVWEMSTILTPIIGCDTLPLRFDIYECNARNAKGE